MQQSDIQILKDAAATKSRWAHDMRSRLAAGHRGDGDSIFVAQEAEREAEVMAAAVKALEAPAKAERMTKEEYLEFIDTTFKEMRDLIHRKNSDYTGGQSNADPFSNFRQADDFGVNPLVGLNIRMGDKFQRIKAFSRDGKLSVKGEGVADAYRDLIGYSLIALGMLKEMK